MDLGESGFSGFEIELEDFEVVKKESLITRAINVTPGGSIHSIPKIVDGIVYFGSMDHYIYALDCRTGKLVWKFKTEGYMDCNSAESYGERIYMGTHAGYLYSLDSKKGKLIWKFKAADAVTAKPLFYEGKLFFSCLDGNVYCLDKNGEEVWRFKTGDPVLYSPAACNGKIYFGSCDSNFYCITPEGKEVWRFKAGDEILNEAPASFYKGIVYFASMDNNLYAVDAESGKEKWRFKTGKYGNCCSPLIKDDVIYHGSRDGVVYAINLGGKEIWRFRSGGLVGVSLTYHEGRIYFGSEDGNIYCLDMEGKEIWRFKTSGPTWNPPAVWKDKLYDGSFDCHFYCIDLKGKEVWRFAASDMTKSKVDPPYKIFEMVVKKTREDEEEGEEKYEVNVKSGDLDDSYSVKSEYATETAYASKKDYGEE